MHHRSANYSDTYDSPTCPRERNVMIKLQHEMGKLQARDQDNGVYSSRPRSATHTCSSLRNNSSPRLTAGEAQRLMEVASKLIAASETVSVIPTSQSRKLKSSRVPASVAQLQRGAAKVQKALAQSLEKDAAEASALRGAEAAAGLHSSSSQSSLSSVSSASSAFSSRSDRSRSRETPSQATHLKSTSQSSVASSASSRQRRRTPSASTAMSLTVPTLASLRYGHSPMVQSDSAVARRPRSALSRSQSKEFLHPSLLRSPYVASLRQGNSHLRRHTAGSNTSLNQRTTPRGQARQAWMHPDSPTQRNSKQDKSSQTMEHQGAQTADVCTNENTSAMSTTDVGEQVSIAGGVSGVQSFNQDGKSLRSVPTQTDNHKSTQTSEPEAEDGEEDTPTSKESTARKAKRSYSTLLQEATTVLKKLEAMVQYEVDIYTTDALPTESNGSTLSIALCGSSAGTGFVQLEEEVTDGSDESLDVRTFRFHCEDIGTIRSVKLQHDGQQKGDVWQPEKVVLRQLPEGNVSYVFNCSRHLYRRHGDTGEHVLKHTQTAMHSPYVQYLTQPGQGVISPMDAAPGQVIMTPNGPMAWLPPSATAPVFAVPHTSPSSLPYPPDGNIGFPPATYPPQPVGFSEADEHHKKFAAQDLSIHAAIAQGKMETVQEMLQSGSHWLSIPDESGLLAIHSASAQGQADCLKLCLAMHGSDVEAATATGFTAMHLAALHGHVRCLKLLGAHGCRVNSRSVDDQTPLHLAAARGHLECCKWLVANRAKLSSKDIHRRKPMKMAKENGHEEVVQFLKSCKEELSKANSALSLLCTPSRKSTRSSHSRRQSGESDQQGEEGDQEANNVTGEAAGEWGSDEEKQLEPVEAQLVPKNSGLDIHTMKERQAHYQEHKEKMAANAKSFLEMVQQEVEVELNAGKE